MTAVRIIIIVFINRINVAVYLRIIEIDCVSAERSILYRTAFQYGKSSQVRHADAGRRQKIDRPAQNAGNSLVSGGLGVSFAASEAPPRQIRA